MTTLSAQQIADGLIYLGFTDCWAMSGNDYENLLLWESDHPKPSLEEVAIAAEAAAQVAADEVAAKEQAKAAAIAHAKSLGFTDDMIAVLYPALQP